MKPKLIVVSHGRMAEECVNSAEMIVGPLPEVQHVSMTFEDGIEGTQAKLAACIDDDSSYLIIADLYGGTPANVATRKIIENQNVRLITGLNLAMVIEYAVSPIEEVDDLVEYLCSIGKKAVSPIKAVVDENDEDE